MKSKLVTAILLILACSILAHAQQKSAEPTKPAETPARIEIAPDARQAVATVQANVRAAQSALEASQLRLENLILKLRLLLKVPDDYELRVDEQGKLYFEKAAATQVGSEKIPLKK